MTEISLQKLSELVSGTLIGNPKLLVSEIITDSRSVVSSDKSIFFAIKGERNDGHIYVEDLHKRGMLNFVISDFKDIYKTFKDANFIVIKDTMEALHNLGKFHRNQFKSKLVAIIGSNGKTVVKEWIYQLLHNDIDIVRSPKSYNSQLGVPLSLCLLNGKYKTAIIEAGISKSDEMKRLEKIVKPDIVIFTSFGVAHQENFKNLKYKATEKLIMARNAEVLIYSPDYNIISENILKEKQYLNKNIFTWSYKLKNTDLYIKSVSKKNTFSEITLIFKERTIQYKIPFIDEASIKNSLSCVSYLITQNLLSDKVLQRFETLEPVEMRVEQKQGINNCIIINDSYNSDIVSLKIAVELQKNISKNFQKTLILSDIMQSGMTEKELYKAVSEIIYNNKVDRFIGVGNNIFSNKIYFNNLIKKEFYKTTKELLKQDLRKKFNNEVILLKGSRAFRFEKISEVLEQKKHRTVLEINLEAITHNLNYYKSLVQTKTKIMVMVKALSYGSGTHEIAYLLQHHNVDYLGVAFADEGVKLRKAGITLPIMVMNPDENSISDIIDFHLEPEIYSFKILKAFLNKLEDYSGIRLPIHIKIDTGMKRLGFCNFEVDRLIKNLKNTELVFVKTIFSHLAAADEVEHDEFTKLQIKKFDILSNKISNALPYSALRHISNTSGIERFPKAEFDMVRIGIGLYGFNSHYKGKLMNVSTLKTRITQIKNVQKGETVGYGRKWKVKQNSKIAIIPIGYADGFSRFLSNGVGEVIINDQKVPVVGNVCMDLCMIDITNIKAEEGSEVIIFGDSNPASEISEKLNTIPYEIIAGISERVKRVYIG